jgi:hypothetical protein
LPEGEEPPRDAVLAEADRLTGGSIPLLEWERVQDDTGNQFEHAAHQYNASYLDQLMGGVTSPLWKPAAESFCASLVLGAYTTLESLATDLWIAAVNARPLSLGDSAIEAKADGLDEEERKQQKTISLAYLASQGFDLSKSVGSMLKTRKKVNFDSIDGIQQAYKAAFKGTAGKIDNLWDATFAQLKVLSLVRNLIAHDGGLVNQRFLDSVKKHSSDFVSLKVNDELAVSGAEVVKWCKPAFTFGRELLALVDDWLTRNVK